MSGESAYITKLLLKSVFMPPGIFVFILLLLAWRLWRIKPQRPRAAAALFIFAAGLYSVSTSVVVVPLARQLENQFKPLPWAGSKPNLATVSGQAIVVLAGGLRLDAPEYAQQAEPSWRSLERLRYGAQLARELKLPLLLSGGQLPGTTASEASAMNRVLLQDFGIQANWVEDRSLDTADNARLSAALLKQNKISKVYLVTHAMHMPRAVKLFEREGTQVIAAPMGFLGTSHSGVEQFVPQVALLQRFYDTLHEWIGSWWMTYAQ